MSLGKLKKFNTFDTMQLNQYISELLYRYECVVVPNFGAFLTHKVSAEINTKTQSFYPPKKRLSFNDQLQSNDGILANHIAAAEQISYENAMAKIAKQVGSIQKRLNKSQTVSLKHIGNIQRGKTGQLRFEPYNHLNYLTDAFGLGQFVSLKVKREVVLKKQRSQTLMKYAAISIVMLGLGGFLSSNTYVQQIKKQNLLAQQQANTALDNQIQEATFIVNTPLPAIKLKLEEKAVGDFHIVAGAFRIKSNSERKLRQLKRLGFNAVVIGQNHYGLYQVAFESYKLRQDAERALYNIKRSQDPAAWLLVKSIP